jgi:hypothetical protein
MCLTIHLIFRLAAKMMVVGTVEDELRWSQKEASEPVHVWKMP